MAKKEVSKATVGASVIQVVEQLKKKATPLLKKASMEVVEKSDYDKLADVICTLKEYRKEADKQEKSITDPANLILKNTRAIFKPFRDAIDQAESLAKSKMIEFFNEQERKAKIIEEKFEKGDIKKLSTVVSKTNQLLDTSSESASVRLISTVEIEDIMRIPREYLLPNMSLIKEALKEGKKVPGCSLVKKKSIAI